MADQDQESRPGSGAVWAYLALSLAAEAWWIWTMIPDHQRTALRMRITSWFARATSGLARRTAAASMTRELATGHEHYHVPYLLARAAAAAQHAYEQQRP